MRPTNTSDSAGQAKTRKRHTAFKFRAYPDDDQEATLLQWQDSLRFLWNCAHEQRLHRMRNPRPKAAGKRWPTAFDQMRELTDCRREIDFIRAVPAMMQQAMLRALDDAWRRSFDGAGKPRWKSKARGDWSQMTIRARDCGVERHRVRIPKLGWVKMVGHRRIDGRPLWVSITRDVDQWFVSITTEIVEDVPQHPNPDTVIGLDVGVANAVADSEGCLIGNPQFLARGLKSLARARRKLTRTKKGSNRRKKAAIRVAKKYRKIRRQRRDWQHNLTARLSKSHAVVGVEALKVANMTKSAKGTVDAPGRNVRQKAGLNRSILDVGWSEIRRQLAYKCDREGGLMVEVPAAYTSQKCSKCGVVDSASRPDQATFACVACGHTEHADVNAAKNIADAASVTARGGYPVTGPTKREKLGRKSPQAQPASGHWWVAVGESLDAQNLSSGQWPRCLKGQAQRRPSRPRRRSSGCR